MVIGAGVAGIGCARTLEQLGAVVTVVEAKPRVGGRCASTKINDEGAAVDLGASWIHGIRKNPLYTAACQLGLHCVDTGDDVALRDGETGVAIERDSAEDKRAFEAFNAALSICKEGRRREGPGRESAGGPRQGASHASTWRRPGPRAGRVFTYWTRSLYLQIR